VARIIEHSARRAGDSERLSARTRWVSDLICEADHLAAQSGHKLVGRDHVEHALQARIRRADRLPNLIQDAVLRGTLLVSTAGTHIGQINGLAVIDLGEQMFGHPVRITATARLGEGDVIDIEREAELGGAIHSKGVMILSSFLAARYSQNLPLSLFASLVFEQSYGPVEGDSASLAELCALLSALAGVGIKQSLAVTGSVDQHGKVQAIGGVNEKIEGFFDICKSRGLTGEQGVVIPDSNVKHLMLREDVVQAAAERKFHIYPVTEVDQAIGLLTGVPAGEPDERGMVPQGTLNYMVAAQLAELSMLRQEYGMASGKRGKKKEKEKD
jgi:predicted ATP-dependent protease